MRDTRSRPPLWFLICVAAALACAMRWLDASVGGLDGTPGDGPHVQHAFFQFLIPILGLIWKGIEAAGRVTLEVLKWVVVNLSLVVTKLGNGFKALGVDLLKGFKKAWEFTRKLYDDVLKPAWAHFWRWFDKFRAWLDSTFRPVLEWLRMVRDNLIGFYQTFVRPWLDLIDVTRRALRVLGSLGIDWARALDARLGRLEALIDRPFRLLLTKINEVIGIVNRVITADGLFQRLSFIRTLARDYQFAWRAITQPYSKPVAQPDRDKMNQALAAKMIAAGVPAGIAVALIAAGVVAKAAPTTENEIRSYIVNRGGPLAPMLDEFTIVWRNALKRPA